MNLSYLSKVFVYDINVHEMSFDEEAQLRCSTDDLVLNNKERCAYLCHLNCNGCFKFNTSASCFKCRYEEIRTESNLLCSDTCPKGFEKNFTSQTCQGFI